MSCSLCWPEATAENQPDCLFLMATNPAPFTSSHTHTHTHTHTDTHLRTGPTHPGALGGLDSRALGPESYYLRGGLSSWQLLGFVKSPYRLFFQSVTRGSDDSHINRWRRYEIKVCYGWVVQHTSRMSIYLFLLLITANWCKNMIIVLMVLFHNTTLHCVTQTWRQHIRGLWEHMCTFTVIPIGADLEPLKWITNVFISFHRSF